MTLDDAESSSRGKQPDTDTSHRAHGPANRGAAKVRRSFHPAPTTAAATGTRDDDDKRHKSRHPHRPSRRHGHYYNGLHALAYVPQEVLYDNPLYHNLRRHRDARRDPDPHTHGRSHRSRRRHHRPHHGGRHRSPAADDQRRRTTMTTPGSTMDSTQHLTFDNKKDGDDIRSDQVKSTQLDGGGSEADNFDAGHQFPFVCRRENITFEHVKMEQDWRKKLEEYALSSRLSCPPQTLNGQYHLTIYVSSAQFQPRVPINAGQPVN